MLQDLRHSVRAMIRAKGIVTVLVLSFGLGTGANAAVYGVLGALLLRGPAGVEDPSRLVDIFTSEFSGTAYGQSSYPDYLSIKSIATSLLAIAAIDDAAVENVRLDQSEQSVRIAAVTEDFFPALQMRAHAGRLLGSADALLDPAAVVVSFSLSEHLGGAATVLGKTLTIGDRPYSIVGVTPPRFRGLHTGRECDAWILMTPPASARGDRRLSVVARLASGVSVEDAEEDLRRLSDDLAARHPDTNRGSIIEADAPRRVTPIRYSQLDPAASTQVFLIGLVVGGASTMLLASACLNVGSLLLSWAVARRRDLAIKMAVGATRGRLVRQLLMETLCLSLVGGGLGFLFAVWIGDLVPALFMAEQAESLDTQLDARAVFLTVGVACLAGALFGVAPAFHGTASPAVTALRADAGGISEERGGVRLRAVLVSAQIALSTVLLLSTGLLIVSLRQALAGDVASAVNQVAFVSMELPGRFGDVAGGMAYRSAVLDQLQSIDGIEAAGWTSTLPLGRGNRRVYRIEGVEGVTDTVELDTNVVTDGYLRALALPCIEGRMFDGRDTWLAPPVAIVDELLARRYFGATATGRHLLGADGRLVEIVGVVRSGRYRTLQQSPQPTVYYPATQEYLYRGHAVVRTARDPAVLLDAIGKAAKGGGEGGTILRTSTLETHLSDSLALDRLTTTLVGLCGLIALAISTIGVYGVMTDAVRRRTREIGVRLALGAGRGEVARLVFTQAVQLAAGGLLIGTVAALALSGVARSFVSGMPSLDLLTVAGASAALALVMAVAAILPLRRALRVNPTIALRAE